MAQALTHTQKKYPGGPFVHVHTLDWQSAADGSVDLDTDPIFGEIQRAVFVPDSGGTQPTDLYDAQLLDEHGINVLAGQGANLSNANPSHVCPGVPLEDGTTTSVRPITVSGVLNLVIANAGDTKGGLIILYVR